MNEQYYNFTFSFNLPLSSYMKTQLLLVNIANVFYS